MAKKATPPPPLGRAPKPGFAHPKFPVTSAIDVPVPAGGYRSQIDTNSPFAPLLLEKTATVQKPPVGFGTSAGDQSRSAFARGMTDTSRNAMRRSIDKFNTEYQTQAEKSRADDLLAQRTNATDRHRMDTMYNIYGQDVLTGFQQAIEDLKSYQDREFKNADAKMTANLLRGLTGILGMF